MPTPASASRTSARRSERSSSSPSSRDAVAAMRRAACSSRASSPSRGPVALAARHDVEGFLAGELERRRGARLSAVPAHRARPRRRPRPGRRDAGRSRSWPRGSRRVAGDLLGPAPLFRVRGRHRAQLVVKTDRPREVASRAAKLLAAAAPAMRRGRPLGSRRRRPAKRLTRLGDRGRGQGQVKTERARRAGRGRAAASRSPRSASIPIRCCASRLRKSRPSTTISPSSSSA